MKWILANYCINQYNLCVNLIAGFEIFMLNNDLWIDMIFIFNFYGMLLSKFLLRNYACNIIHASNE